VLRTDIVLLKPTPELEKLVREEQKLTTEQKWVWLACAVDGEGNMTLSATMRSDIGRRHPAYKPRVIISNSSQAFVDFAKSLVGCGYMIVHKDSRPTRKDVYDFSCPQGKLLDFLTNIRPYLLIKRKQCDLLMEALQILQDNRHYRSGLTLEKNFERLQKIKEELHIANKKGRLSL